LICDTSALLAAFSVDQRFHDECAETLRTAERRFISPAVLTEVDYLSGQMWGQQSAIRITRALAGPSYEILPYSDQTLRAASGVMELYSDLNVGIVDASLVVHAKDFKTNEIFTLDQRHFRAMRGLDGRHFKLLPFDME
jgi:uncharacterized protein